MSPHLLFPHLRGFRLVAIHHESGPYLLEWESTRRSAPCPDCRRRSLHIHSHYTRTVRDLPIHMAAVTLHLRVHKFFCRNPACPRKIFTERLLDLATPYAQHTLALHRWLRDVGVAVGGEAGARLARQQGIAVTGRTLLRLVHQMPLPPYPAPRVIGLDDFAWKRRSRYGAIVVDLERSRVIALLPDRSVPTVAAWLARHPTIDIVARDRSQEFAAAITQALPHAQHVADRFHLTQNLKECVDRLVTRRWNGVRRALAPHLPERFPLSAEWLNVLQLRQDEGDQRYQRVLHYHARGWSAPKIARTVGVSTRTVSRWLQLQRGPGTVRRRRKPSQLDPYLPYLRQRWNHGVSVLMLWHEIRDQGYRGSIKMVYRFVQTLKQEATYAPLEHPFEAVSAQQVTWWLLREPEALTPQDQDLLDLVLAADTLLADAYRAVAHFRQLLRNREGALLDAWLAEARATAIKELQHFADGLERDKDEVQAGLTLPYSTGPVEGHIHRLKLLKRQSYGRASVALLERQMMAVA